MERTLSIIKPDGIEKNIIGKIIDKFESAGLRIAGIKKIYMSKEDAKSFYIVHKDRPFYERLTDFMSSGPSVVMVIEGKGAILQVREIMGATDPSEAAPGTIRAEHSTSIEKNTVHGSDSPKSAGIEIPFFFSELELD